MLAKPLSQYATPFVFSLACVFSGSLFAEGKAVASISLHPAGSFNASSESIEVTGAKKKGDTYTAESISLAIDSLDTGMALRNKHLKEHLLFPKAKEILVKNIVAPVGKNGSAMLTLASETKKIEFKHHEGKEIAKASFSIDLKDFKIGGNHYLGVGVDDKVEIEIEIPMSVFK